MSEKKSKTSDEVDKKKEKKLEKKDAKMQAAENLAGWQKALADYQNLEKEMNRRLSSMSDFVSNAFVLELLPIFDNYQIAIKHIPEDQQKEQWAIGLEHILKLWETFLSDHEVERIKTIGEKFDPHIHESIGSIEDKANGDQIIVEEKMAGYKSKDFVIRPARVIINNK